MESKLEAICIKPLYMSVFKVAYFEHEDTVCKFNMANSKSFRIHIE